MTKKRELNREKKKKVRERDEKADVLCKCCGNVVHKRGATARAVGAAG